MIRILFISIMVFYGFVSLALSQDQAGEMLNDLDIPLMAGLMENDAEAMLFDSPDGRIITAQAKGSASLKEVLQYYNVVLPRLGWKKMTDFTCDQGVDNCYQAMRDDEILILNFKEENGVVEINYALSPK